jgi:CTP:phosphocholine cytidylyltransferase-like protein
MLVSVPFYFFKYYVDKYNLSFVYNSEFLGFGTLKTRMLPLAIFNIMLF